MVYSATSAAAAVGDGDPSYYLKRRSTRSRARCSSSARRASTSGAFGCSRRRLVLGTLFLCATVLLRPRSTARTAGSSSAPPRSSLQSSRSSRSASGPPRTWRAGAAALDPRARASDRPPRGNVLRADPARARPRDDDRARGHAHRVVLLVSGVPLPTLAGAPSSSARSARSRSGSSPYRRARFIAFLDPWSDAQDSGFQIVQAMIGLGSGGVFGAGLGEGVQKIFYLPEAHTDMILAVVGEEPTVGTTAVIAAYAAFAYAGLRIALTCRDPFGKRLAAGLTALVVRAGRDQPRRRTRDGRRSPASRPVRLLRRPRTWSCSSRRLASSLTSRRMAWPSTSFAA